MLFGTSLQAASQEVSCFLPVFWSSIGKTHTFLHVSHKTRLLLQMGEVVGGMAKSEGEQLLNWHPLTTSPVCKALGSPWELPAFLLKQPLPISWVVGCVLWGKLPVHLCAAPQN